MKQLIPTGARVKLRAFQRYLADLNSGQLNDFVQFDASTQVQNSTFQPRVTVTQALLKTHYSENKRHNLKLAIQRIENILIQPDQIFSFWHLVGKPNAAKGYLEGRAIINNQLQIDFGGGLCQLSGMIYLLALRAKLKVLERHPHSKDIYTEETRFTPLGSDATIVYGYKDLRVCNCLPLPLCFRFLIEEHQISAYLCTEQPIDIFEIEFKVKDLETTKMVDTIRFSSQLREYEIIDSTIYKK
jgi:vancomycin resistance protein VanW